VEAPGNCPVCPPLIRSRRPAAPLTAPASSDYKNWLSWQRSLGDRKLISDRLSTTTVADYSTNPQNLMKIGVADFEITGLTGIVKK